MHNCSTSPKLDWGGATVKNGMLELQNVRYFMNLCKYQKVLFCDIIAHALTVLHLKFYNPNLSIQPFLLYNNIIRHPLVNMNKCVYIHAPRQRTREYKHFVISILQESVGNGLLNHLRGL